MFENDHFQNCVYFWQLFCLQVRSVTPWQSHDRKSRYPRGRRHSSILALLDFFIFDVSSGFYLWNVNMTPTWHLSKLFKVAFKDVSTKNSEPTYWTIFLISYFSTTEYIMHSQLLVTHYHDYDMAGLKISTAL
jgi:hypothetical protein